MGQPSPSTDYSTRSGSASGRAPKSDTLSCALSGPSSIYRRAAELWSLCRSASDRAPPSTSECTLARLSPRSRPVSRSGFFMSTCAQSLTSWSARSSTTLTSCDAIASLSYLRRAILWRTARTMETSRRRFQLTLSWLQCLVSMARASSTTASPISARTQSSQPSTGRDSSRAGSSGESRRMRWSGSTR